MQKAQVVQAYIRNLDFHQRRWFLAKQVPPFSAHVQSFIYYNPTQILEVCTTELMIQAKTTVEMCC